MQTNRRNLPHKYANIHTTIQFHQLRPNTCLTSDRDTSTCKPDAQRSRVCRPAPASNTATASSKALHPEPRRASCVLSLVTDIYVHTVFMSIASQPTSGPLLSSVSVFAVFTFYPSSLHKATSQRCVNGQLTVTRTHTHFSSARMTGVSDQQDQTTTDCGNHTESQKASCGDNRFFGVLWAGLCVGTPN